MENTIYTLEDLGFVLNSDMTIGPRLTYKRGTQILSVDLDKMKIIFKDLDPDASQELSYECLQAIMKIFEERGLN